MKKIVSLLALSLIFIVSAVAQGYQVGDIASDFKLKNVDGKEVSLSDYKDAKGYVVIFTCNHCPYSIAYEDRIIALNDKYAPLGYPVIAINPNDPAVSPGDSYADMQKRSKEKKFTFPYLFDEGQKVYPQYGATRTPHVYLLDKTTEGNKVAYIGAIDNNHQDVAAADQKFLENAIESLRQNQKPQPDFTKAIGCTIKTARK